MESLIAIQFNNFVLLAADRTNVFSIIVVKHDANKIVKMSDNIAMGVVGEPGDSIQFAEYISKNIQLYKMRNGYELSPEAAANYVQSNLANYLRSRTPYNVNLLVAGYDPQTNEPSLHYIDYLATSVKVPYGMHGYGAFFVAGLLDEIYFPDATVDEGKEMMEKCIAEIQKRLIVSLPAFKLCIIDKKGYRELSDINMDVYKFLKPTSLDKKNDEKHQSQIVEEMTH